MKDIFVWQFWAGLLFGYFLLARIVAFVRTKVASV